MPPIKTRGKLPCLVQVYTTLPPGINAPTTAYLVLSISFFRANTNRPTLRSSAYKPPDELSVRVRWWGEPVNGACAVFYPRLAHKVGHKQFTRIRARYRITVPLERFIDYLNDMQALYFDVRDDAYARTIGRARLENISRLSINSPIHSALPVVNNVGEKIGDLSVSLIIEQFAPPLKWTAVGIPNQPDDKIQQKPEGERQQLTGNPLGSDELLTGTLNRTRKNTSALRVSFQDDEYDDDQANFQGCAGDSNEHAVDDEVEQIDQRLGVGGVPSCSECNLKPPMSPQHSHRPPDIGHSADYSDEEHSDAVNLITEALERSKKLRESLNRSSTNVASSVHLSDGAHLNCSTDPSILTRSPSNPELHTAFESGHPESAVPSSAVAMPSGLNGHFSSENDVHLMRLLSNEPDDVSVKDRDFGDYVLSSAVTNHSNSDVHKSGGFETGQIPIDELDHEEQLIEQLFFSHPVKMSGRHKSNGSKRKPTAAWTAPMGSDSLAPSDDKHGTDYLLSGHGSEHLIGVRLSVRALQIDTDCANVLLNTGLPDQSDDDRLIKTNVVNLNETNSVPPRPSVRRSSPAKRQSSSKNKSIRLRSRSASPATSRGSRSPSLPRFEISSAPINLEVSVPARLTQTSKCTWLTTSLLFDRYHPRGREEIPDLVGPNKQRMVQFIARDRQTSVLVMLSENVGKDSGTEVASEPTNYIRFRLLTLQPVLLGASEVTLGDLRSVILARKNWRRTQKARIFVHLSLATRIFHQPEVRRDPIGRLELELEPVWTEVDDSHRIDRLKTSSSCPRTSLLPARPRSPQLLSGDGAQTHNQAEPLPIRLETLLSVSEGRALCISGRPVGSTGDEDSSGLPKQSCLQHSYLMIRLPWCQAAETSSAKNAIPGGKVRPTNCRFNSAVSWMGGRCPAYKFALRTPCLLTEALLCRLAHSFAVIEVWAKFTGGLPDKLIGLAKLPTDTFANAYACVDSKSNRVFLQPQSILDALMDCPDPVIVFNSWLPVTDPYSGGPRGQIRARLAVGTTAQLARLQQSDVQFSCNPTQYDDPTQPDALGWQPLDVINWPANSSSGNNTNDCFVEHSLTVTVERLTNFDPHLALRSDGQYSGSVPWGDCDCFIQYFFPTGTHSECLSRYRTPVQLLVAPSLEGIIVERAKNQIPSYSVSCEFVTASRSPSVKQGSSHSYWSQTHRLCFCFRKVPRASDLLTDTEAGQLDLTPQQKGFSRWLLDTLSQTGGINAGNAEDTRGLSFELWLRLYSPNLRDVLVGRGWVTEDVLSGLINLGAEHPGSAGNERHNRCVIRMHDVTSGRLNGRLEVSLTYSLRNVKAPPKSRCKNVMFTPCSQISSQTPSVREPPLIPNTVQPGIRLHLSVAHLSGLRAAFKSAQHLTSSGHMRIHCILLPQSPSLRNCYFPSPVLLGSAVSAPFHELPSTEEINVTLEVLLPLSWRSAQNCMSSESSKDWPLVELILNGEEVLAQQFSGQTVDKCCLLIQVDVWHQPLLTHRPIDPVEPLQTNGSTGWGGMHNGEFAKTLHPGPGYELVASSRLPLGKLIFSTKGSLSSRWSPFGQFVLTENPSQKRITSGICGRFVGGLEWSARFGEAVQSKRRLLQHMVKSYQPTSEAIDCLRKWHVPLPVLTKLDDEDISTVEVDEEPCLWHNGIDERGYTYKHFFLHFDAAYLPLAEVLIQDEMRLEDCRDHKRKSDHSGDFTGFAFIRYQFFKSGTQTSRLVQLPTQGSKDHIVLLNDCKEYAFRVSSDLRKYVLETELELQVWALWTNRVRDNISTLSADTETYGIRGKETVNLGGEPPSPRHIGTARIPLVHLLHPPPNCQGEGENHWDTLDHDDHSPIPPVSLITGDPSGLRWWSGAAYSHPVFPLYRVGDSESHNCWIAARVEMTSSRSQMSVNSPLREERQAFEDKLRTLSSVGELGWNLGQLLTPQHTTSVIDDSQLWDDEVLGPQSQSTFPAEVIVEQAYHLRPKRQTDQRLKHDLPDSEDEQDTQFDDGYVFVTFPVDGDKNGSLTIHDELWNRIVHCSAGQSKAGRIAVTSKVRNGDDVVWNYRRFVRLPKWLLQKYARRNLVFHVWFQRQMGDELRHDNVEYGAEELSEKPKLIGIASVDLSSLFPLFGPATPDGYAYPGALDQVYGWYHVIDSAGLQCGQILLGVKPLVPGLKSASENRLLHYANTDLFELSTDRQLSTTPDPNTVRSSSPLTRMRNLLAVDTLVDVSQAKKEAHRSLQDLTAIPVLSTVADSTEMSRSMLFDSLHAQLTELDAINARLKRKLTTGIGVPAKANQRSADTLGESPCAAREKGSGTNRAATVSPVHLCSSSPERKWGKGARSGLFRSPPPVGIDTMITCNNNCMSPSESRLTEEHSFVDSVSLAPEPNEKFTETKSKNFQKIADYTTTECSRLPPKSPELLPTPSPRGRKSPKPQMVPHKDRELVGNDVVNNASSEDDLPAPHGDNGQRQHSVSAPDMQSPIISVECSQDYEVEHQNENKDETHSDSETYQISPLSPRLPDAHVDDMEHTDSEVTQSDSVSIGGEMAQPHQVEDENFEDDGRNSAISSSIWPPSDGGVSRSPSHGRSCSPFTGSHSVEEQCEYTSIAINVPICVDPVESERQTPRELCSLTNEPSPRGADFERSPLTLPTGSSNSHRRLTSSPVPSQSVPSSSPLLPSFFPTNDAISEFLPVRTVRPLDPRDERLRRLRSGCSLGEGMSSPEIALSAARKDTEFESLRRRLDERISKAIHSLDAGSSANPVSEEDRPKDPIMALLTDQRTRSLQLAERVFNMKL
ncbi:unnamed protein product [Calicophoron daubneyi]|uniref:C2CD3 N-terminal C2 domain-containing protein n=1 Tax=Calicophoron daubneyi TaxID=300641 RepID=A0AAV2T4F0_CALDB